MGVLLKCHSDNSLSLKINWWNWRPILAEIGRSDLIDADRIESLGFNGETKVTAQEASALAKHFRRQSFPMDTAKQVRLDGTLADISHDNRFYRAPQEEHLNYGASSDMVSKFVMFCETCEGFTVF